MAAEHAVAAEAPILEEDSDGVRMMTVHKAKGLEFPVVILADLTCKLARAEAGRWIDPGQNICALKLGGWAPMDLILHDAEESARDRAEGERLAYVAATRARDVLVIPAVGDEIYEGSWLDPLMPAIYPPLSSRRDPDPAPGCPAFPSKDTVLTRADADPARPTTVAPGMFEFTLAASSFPLPASSFPLPASSFPLPASRASRIPDPGSRIPIRIRWSGGTRARWSCRRRTPAACGATISSRKTAIRLASTSAWASIARGRRTGRPRWHAPARRPSCRARPRSSHAIGRCRRASTRCRSR